MAGHHKVLNFVNKFVNLWKSGFEAKLHVEAQAGQAWVGLQVGLGATPQPHHGRKPGPSQTRRRARRAEARAAKAAAQAADLPPANTDEAAKAPLTKEKAVQAVLNPCTVETAVQAVFNPRTIEAAVQAVLDLPHPDHGLPGPAGPPSHLAPAAQAGPLSSPPNFTSLLHQLRHPRHQQAVGDVFCPDRDYHPAAPPPYQVSQGIPQLDGDGSNMDDEWTCKCCRYTKQFPTEQELEYHHNEAHDEFEECNICYSRHVWIDR